MPTRPFFLRMSVKPRAAASAFCATAVASSVPSDVLPAAARRQREVRRAGAGHAAGGRRGDAAAVGHRERHDEHVGGGERRRRRLGGAERVGEHRLRRGDDDDAARQLAAGAEVGEREHTGGVAAELDAQRRHRRARAQPLEPRVARLQVAPPTVPMAATAARSTPRLTSESGDPARARRPPRRGARCPHATWRSPRPP